MDSKENKIVWILVGALVIAIIAIFYITTSLSSKIEDRNNEITSLNRDVKSWRDIDSLEHSRVSVLSTTNVSSILKLKTKDSIIESLQATVREYKKNLSHQGSVTNFSTNTNINSSGQTHVTPKDTIHYNGIQYIYPRYTYDFNLKDKNNQSWITGYSISTKDSTTLSMVVKNKYSVVIGLEGGNLFKKGTPFAEVKNYNPYSENTSIVSYQVSLPKPKRIGIGPFIGYGLTNDFKFQPCIGISLQYSILQF